VALENVEAIPSFQAPNPDSLISTSRYQPVTLILEASDPSSVASKRPFQLPGGQGPPLDRVIPRATDNFLVIRLKTYYPVC